MARAAAIHVSHRRLGIRGIGWIDEHRNTSHSRHQLAQDFQPLGRQLAREKIDSSQVAAGTGEAGNKTKPDRVLSDDENNGGRRRCGLGHPRDIITDRDHQGDLPAHQVGRKRRHSIGLIFRPPVLDRQIFALGVACLLQPLTEAAQPVRHCLS
jgi:hypothetical protein